MSKILQCQNCGKDITWAGLGRKKMYCEDCRKQRQAKFKKEWHDNNILHRRQYIREYMREYMRDQDNQAKQTIRMRSNLLIRQGKVAMQDQCAICGANDDLQCHHISYDLPLCEYAIVTVCRSCHTDIHKGGRGMSKKSEIPIKQLQNLVVMRFADKIYRSCSNCTLSKRRGGECKGKKACIRYTERPREEAKQMEIDMAAREYQQAIRDYEGACFAQKKSKQRLDEAQALLLQLTSEGDQND